MATDKDRQEEYDEAYNQSWAAFGAWQTRAKTDIQAYLGDIFTSAERQKLSLRNSDILNIQLIRPLIKWVSGLQSDHRKGIEYVLGDTSDMQVANDYTNIGMKVMQRNNGYETISRAFEHALKTGLCLVNAFNDVNDNTMLDHYFYNQFLMDPSWTKLDLTDCNFLMMRKFVTAEQAKILLPEGFHSDIRAIDKKKEGNASTDGKFPNYVTPIRFGHNMFSYDEFQQRDTKETTIILIKPTGAELEFGGTRKQLQEQLPQILQANNIPAELISTFRRIKPTVKVSAFLDGQHVATEVDPFGLDDYSATPVQCFYDPEYDQMEWKLQGMVRSLKDIQRAETKRIISSIAWFENSASNGLDFEENTLVDESDAFQTGLGPRKFKEGKLDSARDRATPPLPAGMLELHNLLTDLMPRTVNVNPDMLGLPPDASRGQISGILAELRVGSGIVGLRGLFDDLDQSQNIIGRKLLKLYQRYPAEKIVKILGKQPSPDFQKKELSDFDVISSNAILTATQKNSQYQELLTLMEMGQQIQKPFPAEWTDILELGVLQIAPELLERIKQRQQATQQQAQEAQQRQDAMQDATLQALAGQTSEDQAQAEERRTEAVGNMAQAGLDQAKTITEIQSIENDDNLKRVDQLLRLTELQIEQQKVNQGGKSA